MKVFIYSVMALILTLGLPFTMMYTGNVYESQCILDLIYVEYFSYYRFFTLIAVPNADFLLANTHIDSTKHLYVVFFIIECL